MDVLDLDKVLLPIGTTHVHIAVNSGQISSLRDILKEDNSLANLPDSFGRSPLAVALQNGRLAAAELLIEYGANLDAIYSSDTQHTIGQALTSNPNFFSLLKPLLESSARDSIDLSPTLPVLAYEGKVDILKAVLNRPNVNVDYRDYLQCTALHYASSKGHIEVVKVLLTFGANCQLKTSVGATALHLGCSAGHVDIVGAILDENISPDEKKILLHTANRAGDIPIMCAITNGHISVIEYILSLHLQHLDLGKRLANSHSLSGYFFYLKYILSSQLSSQFYSSSIPCLSVEESQWLLHDSVLRNSPEGVGTALSYGASIECLDYMLQTPLILAAKLGSVDLCRCLVEHGASLNARDVAGKTALMYAFEAGKHKVVEYLLSQPTCTCFHPLSITGPIATPVLLDTLISYFEGSKEGCLIASRSWLYWLAVAVPTAPVQLFQALVNLLAPEDWVEQMITASKNTPLYESSNIVYSSVVSHHTLPVYVQEDIAQDDSTKLHPKLVRSFSRPQKWNFARPPPLISKEWKFKCVPPPKKRKSTPRLKQVPFSSGAKQSSESIVHNAALHNLDILRYILSSCEDADQQEAVLLLKDTSGRTALELALGHFNVISDGCLSLGLLDTAGLDEYLTQEFPLPVTVTFEEALLHYLCFGKSVRSSKKCQSPLKAWSLWYLQLQVNAFCLNNGSDLLLLDASEDRKKLFHLLLDNHHFLVSWGIAELKEYPPLLFAAVQHKLDWAVRPLLSHGADPASHHNARFALEVAARHSQTQVVEALIENGIEPFLALSGHPEQQQLFSSLSRSLEDLVRLGYIEGSVNLLLGLNLGQYLWNSQHAASFLLAIQERYDGSVEYDSVVRDLVKFLAIKIFNSDEESPGNLSKGFCKHLKLIREIICFLKTVKASSTAKNLLNLLAYVPGCSANVYGGVKFGEIFHYLCGRGRFDMVQFMLEACSSDGIATNIVNKVDDQGLTPIVHAACGGHLDIVRYLLNHKADLTGSKRFSPLIGTLLYLAFVPHNVEGDILGMRYHQYSLRRSKILSPLEKYLPIVSFSNVSDDPQSALELVRILLPPSSSLSESNWSSLFPQPDLLFLLISSVRESSAIQPLLERILQNPLHKPGPIAGVSLLANALFLAPRNQDSESSRLFERYLLNFSSTESVLSISSVYDAARKRYWGIVETIVSRKKVLYDKMNQVIQTCFLAIENGKEELFCNLIQEAQLARSDYHSWPKVHEVLVRAAVRTSHPGILTDLISIGFSISTCLCAAVRLGYHEAVFSSSPVEDITRCLPDLVILAAKSNQSDTVKELFQFYQKNSDIDTVPKYPRNSIEFWVTVLWASSSNGHQSLALHAVSCIPEIEMGHIVSHKLFHNILYYACYWGLADLLACLPYHDHMLLERQELRESPFEAAIVNGTLSSIKSSYLSRFILSDDFQQWFDQGLLKTRSYESVFDAFMTGILCQMLSLESDSRNKDGIVTENTGGHTVFRSYNFEPFEKLTGSFCAPLIVLAMKNGEDVLYNAALESESVILGPIVEALFKSGYMAEAFKYSDMHETFKRCGRVSIELLLCSGGVPAELLTRLNKDGGNILHSMVVGHQYYTDGIDLVLNHLGPSAPDMSLALDKHGHSPISLAFCSGKYEAVCELFQVAAKSKLFPADADKLIPELVISDHIYGWFRYRTVVKEIFFSPRDYETTVEDFFESLGRSGNEGRLSFSDKWLTHEWGPHQKKRFEEKLSFNSSARPNPWMVGISWKGKPHTVEITVDWDSFEHCLTPLTSNQQHIPLLVEAVIFSSAVLGRLCTTSEEDGSTNDLADFFNTPTPPESLVLSATRKSKHQFAELTSPKKAMLCLWYNSAQNVFVLPPVQVRRLGLGDASFSANSATHTLTHTFSFGITTTGMRDSQVSTVSGSHKDLCRFYQKKLRRKHRISVSIAVEDAFIDAWTLQNVIELCSEAIILSSQPSTAYSMLTKSIKTPSSMPSPKQLFSHIGINVSMALKEQPTTVAVVSLVDCGLDFSLRLARDTTLQPSCLKLPSHETLLQQTINHVLSREVEILSERLEKFIQKQFLPQLRRSLRSKLKSESVSVLCESSNNKTEKLAQATVEHLVLLKTNRQIMATLLSFCSMLHAYSQKPRQFSNFRGKLLEGLQIVVSEIEESKIEVASPGGLQLTLNTRDMNYSKLKKTLVSLMDTPLNISGTEMVAFPRDLLGEVPCPFLSYVDMRASIDFLYPVVGVAKKLFVQILDYEGAKLKLPLKYNYSLRVTIRSPSGSVFRANSSEDPTTSQGASADLYIATSDDGGFEITWKPSKQGVHFFQLSLNGVRIQQSFEKVCVEKVRSCSGKKVVSAGNKVVFIAAHIGGVCQYSDKKSMLILARDTVLEPSPRLKLLPGYSTFTSPTSSSSSSSSSSSRLSDKLKDYVTKTKKSSEPHEKALHEAVPHRSPLPHLHHVSITSTHGGPREWSHIPTSHVTIHTHYHNITTTTSKVRESSKKPPKLRRLRSMSWMQCNNHGTLPSVQTRRGRGFMEPKCTSLGQGVYRVSVKCTIAGNIKLFASCPICKSVMMIYWVEGDSFFPEHLCVVPGNLSPSKSRLTTSSGVPVERLVFTTGLYQFNLTTRDKYGNALNSMVVTDVVVRGAGPLDVNSSLPSLQEIQNSSRLDSQCKIKYQGSGMYELECTILAGEGRYHILVGPSYDLLTYICIKSDNVLCPRHCWLDPRNKYECPMYGYAKFHIYLYDRYFNNLNNVDDKTIHVRILLGRCIFESVLNRVGFLNRYKFKIGPVTSGGDLRVMVDGEFIADEPKHFKIAFGGLEERLKHFRNIAHPSDSLPPMIVVDRTKILDSALQYVKLMERGPFRVRFIGEFGIDIGGVSSEFFQLLCQELVNPHYALFQCTTSGLFRPSPHSLVNTCHLRYFSLCGIALARMFCDNYQSSVRFTPAVYKYLLGVECTIEDLEIDDPILHRGLSEVVQCETEDSLAELVTNFTTTLSHFGSLTTVELERGGQNRQVTLQNRINFVTKFYKWHLIGAVKTQLDAISLGIQSTIPTKAMKYFKERFSWQELEMVLGGHPSIDVSFLKSQATYRGYTDSSCEVIWLWQVLETLSQKELSQFLQFMTGSGCVPVVPSSDWKMTITRGLEDETLLPIASTCFNTLILPRYSSHQILQQKLIQAISLGHLHFCNH